MEATAPPGRARSRAFRWLPVLLASALLHCAGCPPEIPPGPGTAEFLDENDFSGSFTPRKRNTYYGGESTFNGRIVFTNIARSIVDDVLPSDLHLAPPSGAGAEHPVAMSWGHQTESKLVFPFWTPSIGQNYQELILVIPFVQKQNSTLWHNFVVRLYLNDFYALQIGNLYYGLRKKEAGFIESATAFDVKVSPDILMFQSTATPGAWLPNAQAEQTLDNYQDMKKIWSMPVMGTLSYSPGKPKICTYFEWNFDNAEVRPISTQYVFKQEFVVGEMMTWVNLGMIPSVASGAWEVRGLRWRMGFPAHDCKY